MQNDFGSLESKAVKAAVSSAWDLAKDLNTEILRLDPANLNAKIRLGKAFLELREFQKARKLFKEVLHQDPINSVAIKNLEFAKEERRAGNPGCKYKNIITEPATCLVCTIEITAKGITGTRIPSGLPLELKILTNTTKVFGTLREVKTELGVISDMKAHKSLKSGKDKGAIFKADYIKGSDKTASIMITSDKPIFESDRQDVKPYTKKDFTDSDEPSESPADEN